MSKLLAIDPGKHGSGYAVFVHGTLISAGYCKPGRLLEVTQMICELPQVYRNERSKGDPKHLIELARVVGHWEGLHHSAEHHTYLPRDWKGQLPKEVTRARAHTALRTAEIERVPGLALSNGGHDMWDAIAIGLVFEGRLRLRR